MNRDIAKNKTKALNEYMTDNKITVRFLQKRVARVKKME